MQVLALMIAVDMENAQLKVYAYAKMDSLELIVPLVNVHTHIVCVNKQFY